MPSVPPWSVGYDFANDTAAQNYINSAALQAQFQSLGDYLAALELALETSIRADDTLTDEIVRTRNLHPEVVTLIEASTVGPQGPPGADGTDGADGAPGPQGPIGPTGPSGSTPAWADITSKPTTLAGFGITDAAPIAHVGAGGASHADVIAAGASGFMTGADKTKLNALDPANFAPVAHVGAGGSAHSAATTGTAGFLSAADKTKLDASYAASVFDFLNITGGQTVIPGGSAPIVNYVYQVEGSAGDITLPAAPAVGSRIGFSVSDFSVVGANAYRLDAGAGVKIAGRTRYLVLLHSNSVVLWFDGTNWLPLVMNLDTPWAAGPAFSSLVSAITTAPTFGTKSVDKTRWRRIGNNLELTAQYVQSTAGSNGSGRYLLALPYSLTIDTTDMYLTPADATLWINDVGNMVLGDTGTQEGSRHVLGVYDTTTVFGLGSNWSSSSANNDYWGSGGGYRFGVTVVRLAAKLSVPITNW